MAAIMGFDGAASFLSGSSKMGSEVEGRAWARMSAWVSQLSSMLSHTICCFWRHAGITDDYTVTLALSLAGEGSANRPFKTSSTILRLSLSISRCYSRHSYAIPVSCRMGVCLI